MNMLFGLITALSSVGILLSVYFLIPERVWEVLPEPISKNKGTLVSIAALVITLFITWSSIMTYGPKVRGYDTVYRPTVEAKVLEQGPDIFEFKDRSTVFSDKLEEGPATKPPIVVTR